MNQMPSPIEMGHDVWLLDLLEQGRPCRTGAYLIKDEYPTLIETGSATSHEALVHGLTQLGMSPTDLKYVIVTHVHLDHAGGAGQMMKLAKNAQLVVHPRGARHMADPSKLWQGAGTVYGDRLVELFGSVEPVPETQILVRDHEETLHIGKRTLTFFDSPGHAKHHFTILDPLANALYAGDAVGIRYRSCFTGWDFEWVMPSTSPIDFDPDAVQKTMDMLRKIPFEWVYHTHFGKSSKTEAIENTEHSAWSMAELIRSQYHDNISDKAVISGLRSWITTILTDKGHQVPDDLSVLDVDVILDALGLIYYEQKRLSTFK